MSEERRAVGVGRRLDPRKVGVAVFCSVCRLRKKPIGRSAPLAMAGSLCDYECEGYRREPYVGSLWPRGTASVATCTLHTREGATMTSEPTEGYGVCSASYLPAGGPPLPDLLWCGLPVDHDGVHRCVVAPRLAFEWASQFGQLRVLPNITPLDPTGQRRTGHGERAE